MHRIAPVVVDPIVAVVEEHRTDPEADIAGSALEAVRNLVEDLAGIVAADRRVLASINTMFRISCQVRHGRSVHRSRMYSLQCQQGVDLRPWYGGCP